MLKKIIIKISQKIFYITQRLRFFSTNKKRKIFKLIFRNKYRKYDSKKIINPEIGYLKLDYQDQTDLKKNIDKCIFDSTKIFQNQKTSSGSKEYLRNILSHENKKEIQSFLNFFLNQEIINIVGEYLSSKPLLVELKLLHSPIIENIEQSGSQLFHCDYDDDRIVKLFLNIFDTNENSGPLEAISAKKTLMLREEHDINLGDHTNSVEKNVTNKDIKKFLGLKGDLTVIDTSNCFHRGSFNVTKDRLILYGNYVSRSSYRFPPILKKMKYESIIKLHSPLSIYSNLVDSNKKTYLINN